MDILLICIGFVFIISGIAGALLPILPGPPLSWLGLLFLYLTKAIPMDWSFLGYTLFIAILVTILDYIIPPMSTKKFGGSKKGVWGSTIGLIIGVFTGPVGIVIGPFIGALIGELLHDSKETKKALKAAIGSFVGFLFSTTLKLVIAIIFLWYFCKDVWQYKEVLFHL